MVAQPPRPGLTVTVQLLCLYTFTCRSLAWSANSGCSMLATSPFGVAPKCRQQRNFDPVRYARRDPRCLDTACRGQLAHSPTCERSTRSWTTPFGRSRNTAGYFGTEPDGLQAAIPGRAAWLPEVFRASIHASTSLKSQATFRLVSAIRRGNSPRCSVL